MNPATRANAFWTIVEKLGADMTMCSCDGYYRLDFPEKRRSTSGKTLVLYKKWGLPPQLPSKYSPRRGTLAATMENQVPDAVKRERLHRAKRTQNASPVKTTRNTSGCPGSSMWRTATKSPIPFATGSSRILRWSTFRAGRNGLDNIYRFA